jgi:lipoprotein NlpI
MLGERMLSGILASARYLLGYRAIQRRKWHKAIAHLSEAIRLLPRYPAAFSDRGLAYQGISEHRLATLDFSRAIELDPTLGMAYYNRGISAKFLGDYDWAVADHAQAIALNPSHADAYGEQGVAYACKHEYDLAIASITKAMKLDPDKPIHPRERGYTRFHRGDFAASAADLRLSLDRQFDPYAMLFCYLARARLGEAAEEQLRSDSRRLRSKVWPSGAVDLYLGSRTPDALLAALTEPDEHAEAHFYVGQWYLLRGNQTEAVKAFRNAMQECPTVFLEHIGAVAELARLGGL